uniref:Uncharacterized protein n=1 Tax=Lacticaseibacillus paracasei subsp. paracasei TaxID=47714 RepID=Q3MN22_LACPA|nr:hypothetical protein [Lacticaseibacillus paracasei subsp. paracasei]
MAFKLSLSLCQSPPICLKSSSALIRFVLSNKLGNVSYSVLFPAPLIPATIIYWGLSINGQSPFA